MNLGLTELARFYGLPVSATGFSSDAKDVGMSCGLDDGSTSLVSMLARCDLLYGIGLLDAAQMLFLPKTGDGRRGRAPVAARRRGCRPRRRAPGCGADRRGGARRQLPRTKATKRAMRAGEHYQPRVFRARHLRRRRVLDALDLERATLEVERILAEHTPPPLPPGAMSASRRSSRRLWRTSPRADRRAAAPLRIGRQRPRRLPCLGLADGDQGHAAEGAGYAHLLVAGDPLPEHHARQDDGHHREERSDDGDDAQVAERARHGEQARGPRVERPDADERQGCRRRASCGRGAARGARRGAGRARRSGRRGAPSRGPPPRPRRVR